MWYVVGVRGMCVVCANGMWSVVCVVCGVRVCGMWCA